MGYQEAAILSTLRIAKMVNALVDPRLIPGDLKFLKSTPFVPTIDSEVIARVLNQVPTADIIADDQKAHVYAAQRLQLELNHIPNIKVGFAMTQALINLWTSLRSAQSVNGRDIDLFTDGLRNLVQNAIRGVQQRIEALIVAMHVDQMPSTYSTLGIQFGNISWGMFSDLKGVSQYSWSDPVNSTPVNDIWGLKLVGSTKYGKNFDRVRMATAAFRLMIATQEFQNKARTFLAPNVSYINLPLANLQQQQQIAVGVLGMDIDFCDARFPVAQRDGTAPQYFPYLPLNLVSLDEKANDNNRNIMDWGNTMPTETQMNDASVNIIGGPFPAPQYGPVAYAALADGNLNPPGYNVWGVARGFPRKFDQAATAVLNVGVVPDILSPTIVFPS